jgi:hypothetical protein
VACESIRHGRDPGEQAHDVVVFGAWAIHLAQVLGADVMQELTTFARMDVPGAQITIRRTRGGLTAQLTGPVVGGPPREPTPEFMQELIQETT